MFDKLKVLSRFPKVLDNDRSNLIDGSSSHDSSAHDQHLQSVFRAGHFFFFVYICLSAIYYLERSLHFDGALYCFKMVHSKTFTIENDRWGIVFTQVLPLLALKLNCSLKTFLLCYSLSFAIWNYIFFVILIKLFRNALAALAFILSLILFYRYSFYYPVSEIHSSIGPLFVLFSALHRLFDQAGKVDSKKLMTNGMALLLLAVWLCYIHIITIIPLLFFCGYLILEKKAFSAKFKSVYLVILLATAVYIVVLKLIPAHSYQGSKLLGLDSILSVISDPTISNGFFFFKTDFMNNYSVNVFFFCLTLILLIYKKHFLKSLYVLAAVLAFWVVIMAYNINIDSPLNYQNYYCYLGIIISLPLSAEFLLKLKKNIFVICFATLLAFNFYKIGKSGLRFVDRTAYIKRCLDNFKNYKEKKFVVSEFNFDPAILWGQWDLSFESLFLSSLEGPSNSRTFFTDPDMNKHVECVNYNPNCFIGVDFSPNWFSVQDIMSSRYFDLGKDIYRLANSVQNSDFQDSLFSNKNVVIRLNESYALFRSENRQIELMVDNKTNETFRSITSEQKKLRLSYRIYDEDGKLVVTEGNRTSFEVDIPAMKSIKNGLSIGLKGIQRGKYVLEVDIVHENKRWFNINARTKLIVY
jgi:hypothetical protein